MTKRNRFASKWSIGGLAATSLLNPVSSTANSVTATKRLPDEPYGTYVFPSGSSRRRSRIASATCTEALSGLLENAFGARSTRSQSS